MIRAFRAEWVKLLRLGQILGSWGTMVGFGLLLTILLIANAGTPAPAPPECTAEVPDEAACARAIAEANQQSQQNGPTIAVDLIEDTDGGIFAFQATGQLLGIIALVIAAANVATEYTSGTLKALLVREPRRTVLLVGKVGALWSFILVGITLTLAVTVLTSFLVAAGRGIDTTAWWTGDGWSALGQAYVNVVAGAFVWSLMGTMLAILFRSGFPAIGIGIAYPLVVEGLLGLVMEDVVKWMPGSVLATVAAGDTQQAFGGSSGLSYETALLLALAYAAVFAAVSMGLLHRRDVS
ncbi:MAG: ABC transporter permease subunit [Candidatus Thermoplasmatota archaeon]